MENIETEEKKSQSVIQNNVPLYYANGVTVKLTLTDIHLYANVNGNSACILALPLPAAKSLMMAINEAIRDYELKTGIAVIDLQQLSTLSIK